MTPARPTILSPVSRVLSNLGWTGLCLLAVYALGLSETGAWVAMGAIVAVLGIETAYLIWKDSRDERLRREQRFRTRDF